MSLKRGVFYTFITQIPTVLLGIIAGIFVNRILGPEGKGIYAILQADIALFAMFLGLNISFGLIYFISREEMPKRKVIGIATLLLTIGTVLFGGTLAVLWFFFPNQNFMIPGGLTSSYIYGYLFFAFFLTLLNTIISGCFQGVRNFKVVNQVTIINSVANAICFSLLFFTLRDDLPNAAHLPRVLGVSLGILSLNTFVWVISYVRKIKLMPSFKLKASVVKKVLKITLLGYFANLLNLLNYRLDIWVLEHYKGNRDVGLYELATNFAQMLWNIAIPISTVLTPYLNNPKEPNKWRKFTFFSRLTFTLSTGAAIVMYFLAGFLIPIMYGEEFSDSTLPFQILLPGIIFSCSSKIFAVACISAGKVGYNLIATVIGLAITIVLDFMLIPTYGYVGASIASSVAYTAIFIAVWFMVIVLLKKPFRNYFILQWEDIKAFKSLIRGLNS